MANTLAYNDTATITAVKSFIVQAPGITGKKFMFRLAFYFPGLHSLPVSSITLAKPFLEERSASLSKTSTIISKPLTLRQVWLVSFIAIEHRYLVCISMKFEKESGCIKFFYQLNN